MRILVLYEELAWYFVNCLNVLCRDNNCKILVLCKKANATAPFEFKNVHPSISIKDRNRYSEKDLIDLAKDYNPDFIFMAGWIFRPYIKILKSLKPAYSVIGFDNQYNGSLKQKLGAIYFRIFLRPYIKKAFVPGKRQALFAKTLGFDSAEIITGAYCCDYDLFSDYYKKTIEAKTASFPKRFLYVGRYAEEKGIEDLWKAFIELQDEKPSDWELWCLGKGAIVPVKHEKIKHFGFKQPEDMMDIIKNTGIFVLPSAFEPWGVVVHEYAAAGFPLLCSDKVGAADAFLKEGENGFIIRSGNKNELKSALKKFMVMPEVELRQMAAKSIQLASALRPEIWASNLMKEVTK